MSLDLQRKLRIALLLFLPCTAVLAGIASRAPGAVPPGAVPPGAVPPSSGRVLSFAGEQTAAPASADPRRRASERLSRALGESARRAWVAPGLALARVRALVSEPRLPRDASSSGEDPQGRAVAPAAGTAVARAVDSSWGAAAAHVPGQAGDRAPGAVPGDTLASPAEGREATLSDRQVALKAAMAAALRSRHRLKSAEEERVEALIQAAFQEYFRDYTVAGRKVTVRMPFGLDGEREGGSGYDQRFYLGGKGRPEELWKRIDSVVASEDLARFFEALSLPGEKVMVLDLERRSYRLFREPGLLGSLRTGSYPGTPTRIFVYRFDGTLPEVDLYNYLYAVASVGVDCSGLVHYVHQSIAQACGADLEQALAAAWRIRPSKVRFRIGMWYYDPAGGYTQPVEDRIEDLRPADVLLFEGSDGSFKHSAVIQSIDFEEGLIRYVQSTDWAAQSERGVHQSLIRFDPAHPEVDLRHYSVRWLQQVRPPFEGELEPRDWLDDGDRYLWYLDAGGSRVVRLKALAEVLLEREPRFYTNLDQEHKEESAAALPEPPPGP